MNVYDSQLQSIAPKAESWCEQKRTDDMVWSEKVIDLAGENIDDLGCHNYEYEPRNFETGLRRIRDYLRKLSDYVRASKHPHIEIGALEWSPPAMHLRLARRTPYAGSLTLYEELSPVSR